MEELSELLALCGELVYFGSGEQKCAHSVDIASAGRNRVGRGADLLDGTQAAIGVDMREQSGPGFDYHGLVGLAIEQAVVDAPGKREGEERRARYLGMRIRCLIEQA